MIHGSKNGGVGRNDLQGVPDSVLDDGASPAPAAANQSISLPNRLLEEAECDNNLRGVEESGPEPDGGLESAPPIYS